MAARGSGAHGRMLRFNLPLLCVYVCLWCATTSARYEVAAFTFPAGVNVTSDAATTGGVVLEVAPAVEPAAGSDVSRVTDALPPCYAAAAHAAADGASRRPCGSDDARTGTAAARNAAAQLAREPGPAGVSPVLHASKLMQSITWHRALIGDNPGLTPRREPDGRHQRFSAGEFTAISKRQAITPRLRGYWRGIAAAAPPADIGASDFLKAHAPRAAQTRPGGEAPRVGAAGRPARMPPSISVARLQAVARVSQLSRDEEDTEDGDKASRAGPPEFGSEQGQHPTKYRSPSLSRTSTAAVRDPVPSNPHSPTLRGARRWHHRRHGMPEGEPGQHQRGSFHETAGSLASEQSHDRSDVAPGVASRGPAEAPAALAAGGPSLADSGMAVTQESMLNFTALLWLVFIAWQGLACFSSWWRSVRTLSAGRERTAADAGASSSAVDSVPLVGTTRSSRRKAWAAWTATKRSTQHRRLAGRSLSFDCVHEARKEGPCPAATSCAAAEEWVASVTRPRSQPGEVREASAAQAVVAAAMAAASSVKDGSL